MTLVEAVVALALAALLIASLAGVMSGMARKNKTVDVSRTQEWLHELDRRLWNDLAQARSVSFSGGVLVLEGIPRSSPVGSGTKIIRYQIADDQQSPRLIRTSQETHSTGKSSSQSQTLLWNVERFSILRFDDAGALHPLPKDGGPPPFAVQYALKTSSTPMLLERKVVVR